MSTDLAARLRAVVEERLEVARAANVKQDDPVWWVNEVMATGGEHFTVRSRRDNRPIARVQRLDGDDGEPGDILDGRAVAAHIALNDPADAILAGERDLAVLGRHDRDPSMRSAPFCRFCTAKPWPCVEIRDLARRYRVGVDDAQ